MWARGFLCNSIAMSKWKCCYVLRRTPSTFLLVVARPVGVAGTTQVKVLTVHATFPRAEVITSRPHNVVARRHDSISTPTRDWFWGADGVGGPRGRFW